MKDTLGRALHAANITSIYDVVGPACWGMAVIGNSGLVYAGIRYVIDPKSAGMSILYAIGLLVFVLAMLFSAMMMHGASQEAELQRAKCRRYIFLTNAGEYDEELLSGQLEIKHTPKQRTKMARRLAQEEAELFSVKV